MNRKLKVLFIISLLTNVLFAGVILGALPQRISSEPSNRERLRREIESLPDPARSRIRAMFEQARDPQNPLRLRVREARNRAAELLAADPFDESAYDRAIEELIQARLELIRRLAADLKDGVLGLPADQRRAVAQLIRQPRRD